MNHADPRARTQRGNAVESRTNHAGSAAFRATHDEADIQLIAGNRHGARQKFAVEDLAESARLSRLFRTLGWLDIKTRYRGSVLGPFWLTLSTAILVATLGGLYSVLFHLNLRDYLPFLALSLVLWNFLAALVSDACTVFTNAVSTIRSMRMPFFVFAGQSIYRNILILAHNLVVIVVVFIVFKVWPGVNGLASLPGMVLWVIDAFAFTMLLGAFCARFRDVPPIVGSVMQIAFYVSPVIWKPELLPAHARAWLPYNPFYALFEVVRAPLLGTLPHTEVWLFAIGDSIALCAIAWFAFVRVRSRIAFWV